MILIVTVVTDEISVRHAISQMASDNAPGIHYNPEEILSITFEIWELSDYGDYYTSLKDACTCHYTWLQKGGQSSVLL